MKVFLQGKGGRRAAAEAMRPLWGKTGERKAAMEEGVCALDTENIWAVVTNLV